MSLSVSNGIFLNKNRLIEKIPGSVTNQVYPSGGPFTTISAAMLPFAPGLFSTTKGFPMVCVHSCAIILESKSIVPPGGLVEKIRTGFSGQFGIAGVWAEEEKT
jgi:hypothetical protein